MSEQRNHYPAFRSLTMMTVAKIEIIEGAGEEGDPIRLVTYYVDPETSNVLARVDAFESEPDGMAGHARRGG